MHVTDTITGPEKAGKGWDTPVVEPEMVRSRGGGAAGDMCLLCVGTVAVRKKCWLPGVG